MSASQLQRLLLLVLVSLLAAIGVVVLTHRTAAISNTADTVTNSKFDGPTMPPGLHAANFSLLDQAGHRVSLAQYRGHVVILTFIHSQCHDACPLMVEQIKGALNDLPNAGAGVPAIGISVAPAEDSRAHRVQFLAKHEMSGRLAYLSGPTPEMSHVWHAYGIQPVTPKIDHSTFVILIDKRGLERVGFAADQLTPEGLSHDILQLEHEPA